MYPTEQGGGASSSPYSDLDARLLAMRLGDPSSSRQQAVYPAPMSLPLPSPQREFTPAATPAIQPLPYLHLLGQEAKRKWLQSHLHLLGHGGGENSAGAGCVSPVGASSSSSIFSSHSLRYNASAAPFLPKVPKPSELSASAEDIQPVPKPSNLSASAAEFKPIPKSYPWTAQSSWTPSSSASQYLPQLGAAAASSTLRDNASLDPYASALLTAGHANQDGSQSQWWDRAPAIDQQPWLDEVQARLLYAQRKPASLTPAEAAERVVYLLAERGKEMRLRVLDVVKRAVCKIMSCRDWHVVFLALLLNCERRPDELHGIVMAACTGDGSLMGVATEVHGERALKELIRVVAPYPQLSQPLIIRLLRERLMEHEKGAQLLCHCFTTLPYKDCLIIFRHAIATRYEMVSSMTMSGSKCLIECFEHAINEELRALELFILNNTYALAKGQYSTYFLQRVLECGSKRLQEDIAESVAHCILNLSDLPAGSFVVEACINLTCSLVPLLRVLTAFQNLHDGQLAQMVEGRHSNYVVQMLLKAGKPHFPEQTRALARRIVMLPLENPRSLQATRVMRIAKKLFPKWMYST